jgi:hypothetical protein
VAILAAVGIGVALLLVLVGYSARSAITVAVVEVRAGKAEITRGALAPRVLADVRDVVSRPKIASATLRIVRAKDRARVEIHGDVSDGQAQRLRNVIGNVPVAQLATGKKPKP